MISGQLSGKVQNLDGAYTFAPTGRSTRTVRCGTTHSRPVLDVPSHAAGTWAVVTTAKISVVGIALRRRDRHPG